MTLYNIGKAKRLEKLEAQPPSNALGLSKPVSEMTPAEKVEAVRIIRAEQGLDPAVGDPETAAWLASMTLVEKRDALLELRRIKNDTSLTFWQKQQAAAALMAKRGTKVTEEK